MFKSVKTITLNVLKNDKIGVTATTLALACLISFIVNPKEINNDTNIIVTSLIVVWSITLNILRAKNRINESK